MKSDLLTTSEAALMAGVGTTSVKRWAEEGRLPCVKTAGGHRRFRRSDLQAVLASLNPNTTVVGSPSHWASVCLKSDLYQIQGALLQARSRHGNWTGVATEVAAGLAAIGRQWRERKITILDEHLASELLARALTQIKQALPVDTTGPRCLLVCAEGDLHTLGLSLAEVCILESGWRTLWGGARTPMSEVCHTVESGKVEMVVLAASTTISSAQLTEQLHPLEATCKAHNVPLILGGGGTWPETEWATRIVDFPTLEKTVRHRLAQL